MFPKEVFLKYFTVSFFIFWGVMMNAETKSSPVHLLSIGIERHDVGLAAPMHINGFEVDKMGAGGSWFDKLETKLTQYKIMHPYYLKVGQNELVAQYWIDDGREVDMGAYQIIFTITDFDYDKFQYDKTLIKLQSPEIFKTEETQKNKKTLSAQFDFKGDIPKWSWLTDPKIEDSEKNKKSLYAEYVKFGEMLKALGDKKSKVSLAEKKAFEDSIRKTTNEFVQASEMRGNKYTHIDEMFEMARTLKERKIPVSMRPLQKIEEVGLKIFANGTRARLVREPNSFLEVDLSVEYVGGVHDANPGPAGDHFALWFKQDKNKKWVIDAVVPLGGLSY